MGASELLRDDYGRKIFIGSDDFGTVTVNFTDRMTSVLVSLSGERLAAFREAIDRQAMPGQEGRRDGGHPLVEWGRAVARAEQEAVERDE